MQWHTDYVPRKNNWLGNLRWFVREMEEAGHFRFSVIPVDREHCSLNENGILMNFQTLFVMALVVCSSQYESSGIQ